MHESDTKEAHILLAWVWKSHGRKGRVILYYEFGAQHKTITKDKIINSDDIF